MMVEESSPSLHQHHSVVPISPQSERSRNFVKNGHIVGSNTTMTTEDGSFIIQPILDEMDKSESKNNKSLLGSTLSRVLSLSPVCVLILMFRTLMRSFLIALRIVLIIINNAYCIPTYTVWMITLLPLHLINSKWYWKIEGLLFHWLLSMVSLWSYSAGYHIMESGDEIDEVIEKETLVLVNHQSTSDVPLLMAAFNTRANLLPNLNWVMDRIFKFTNFGIVSTIHGDFFVASGRDARERTVKELSKYLTDVYIPRERKWLVLFPEGGFLYKRREASQRYANRNNLPYLENVTLPRMGAVQAIIDGIGPNSGTNSLTNSSSLSHSKNNLEESDRDELQASSGITGRLKYVLDITLAYPQGKALDILTIVGGHVRPCNVHLHYRLFPIEQVPVESASFTEWLYGLYVEKEEMLREYYESGVWRGIPRDPEIEGGSSGRSEGGVRIKQNLTRILLLHTFFISSTIFHVTLLYYIVYLISSYW